MREELEALRKNETWVLTDLPKGKKVVGCTWVYTVKKNPEGKIERYKAGCKRLYLDIWDGL